MVFARLPAALGCPIILGMAALAKLVPQRRWAQFSLGSLFLAVTVLSVWLGVVANQARRQREAVAAIEAHGGKVFYAEPDPQ